MDARDWIVRLNSGEISAADIERFKAWRDGSPDNRQAFERERAFWQELQVLDPARRARPAALTAASEPRRPTLGRRGFLIGGAAMATAAAVIALPRLEIWWNADFRTGVGESAEFILPDGSTAALNTDSGIAVRFQSGLRLVELLRGEAEFRVKPSETVFRVAALGGNTDALGTVFSVQAFDDVATVTVAEGEVRVSGQQAPQAAASPEHGGVVLAASEQTRYAAGGLPDPAIRIETDTVFAWRSGRIIFEGRPFDSAIAELGRYLPERIVLAPNASSSTPVSAIFSTGQALAAVRALARTQGLSVRRVPGVVVLIS
ncbi:iron dicitrate transporter FecR [Kaistia sp. 32K]|nr:iron dicitrate transporter FecR [Kaistia sp. 32K]